jgi:hypothetical protein
MDFHLSLQPAYPILQLSTCPPEGVVNGKAKICVTFVRKRCSADINRAAIRQSESDIDLMESALVVMGTGALEHHAASGYARETLFKFLNMRSDHAVDFRIRIDSLKINFYRRLHVWLQFINLPRVSVH